jgi:hypothetical protein
MITRMIVDAIVLHQRREHAAIEAGIDQSLRGQIGRVRDRDEIGHRRAQCRAERVGEGRQIEADRFGRVERHRLERARFAEDRGARQDRAAAHCEIDDVAHLLQVVRQHDAGALDQHAHHVIIARHRAGMRRRGFAACGTLARVEQHDRLARGMRSLPTTSRKRAAGGSARDHRDRHRYRHRRSRYSR